MMNLIYFLFLLPPSTPSSNFTHLIYLIGTLVMFIYVTVQYLLFPLILFAQVVFDIFLYSYDLCT